MHRRRAVRAAARYAVGARRGLLPLAVSCVARAARAVRRRAARAAFGIVTAGASRGPLLQLRLYPGALLAASLLLLELQRAAR